MKKKTVKKLVLAKETLRGLGHVVGGTDNGYGGITVVTGCTDCDPSNTSCNTCQSCPC
jgi:hypothetical protein